MIDSNKISDHLDEILTDGFSPEEKDQILQAAATGAIQYSDDDEGSRDWSRSDPSPPAPAPRARKPAPEPPAEAPQPRTRFQAEWEIDVRDYEMHKPDVIPALEHYSRSRRAELASLNGPAEAEAALGAEVARIIEYARSRGENPAEYFYRLAERRGYAPAKS